MVRRRGGGTGGTGQEKRQATTPVGGTYKDARRNIQGDEEYEEEEEWTKVTRNRPKTPPNQSGSGSGSVPNTRNQPDPNEQPNEPSSRPTFASVLVQSQSMQSRRDSMTSAAGNKEKKTLDRIFRTPDPEGPMRDDIVVEIQTVNDRPFKGSLTFTEAKDGVFSTCMGLDIQLLHGIRFAFSTYPVVKFKLKEQIDVDRNLQHMEYFNFERRYTVKGVERSDILGCKIKGLRTGSGNINSDSGEPDPDPNIRWVKIEWVDYAIEENQILDWLNHFGEQAGQLSEDIHPNSDSDAAPIGNGTFSIKMRLRTSIPQLLPMWGKRVRIYHRGVEKLCSNCFGTHPRRNCRSEKVAWTRYVLNFMEKHPDIPSEHYGRWWKVINDEFGEIIPEGGNIEQTNEVPSTLEPPSANSESTSTHVDQSRTARKQNIRSTEARPTREEENNLSEYLSLGMSIKEAREAFKIEIEAAELRFRIRDNQRARQSGSIQTANRTRTGPSTSGRGGLTFN